MTLRLTGGVYTSFLADKDYAPDSKECIQATVEQLVNTTTTADRPGMLLGKVQSGKTRTFFGVLSLAFDNGFDFAVVLTKGTVALAEQTIERLKKEFKTLIEADMVQVFDIMHLPSGLPPYVLNQKLIIVCKKEDDNIRRLEEALFETYPILGNSNCLIIDDEADFASVGFRRTKEEGIKINKIAGQIDNLRKRLRSASFLQVTATPYSLYLQPSDPRTDGHEAFLPVRPAFTTLVPVHDKYVGGDYYFEHSKESNTVASYLHREVEPSELRVLRKQDGRMFKLSEALTSPAVQSLRYAIVTFIVGGCLRRLQAALGQELPKKFSFIVHTERSRMAHAWQEQVVAAIVEALKSVTSAQPDVLRNLTDASYQDLQGSLKLLDAPTPSFDATLSEVTRQLPNVMITRVNSEKDIKELLDESGQLYLRAPLNIFIGGQILDRGLTIANLIGFYYGRTANRSQQDTVLQHSRMYGPRPLDDLAVTRFYTTPGIYGVMSTIHEFDAALRNAFEKGGQDAGVVFLRKDDANRIVPCSPNKILLSSTTTLRPRRRLLPVGFQTGPKRDVKKSVEKIDGVLEEFQAEIKGGKPFLLETGVAKAIVDMIRGTFVFEEDDAGWDVNAFKAAIDYLSKANPVVPNRGKLWCLVRRNRDIGRRRLGRYQDAPDTKQEQDVADGLDPTTPLLMLLRENGKESDGWQDCPFWWPVLQVPRNTKTVIYTSEMQDLS
jgi:uncharacterized protein (UPF0335 family)